MEKNLTDNYEKQIYIGRDLFLRYDQDMLIKKYKLKNDHAYLYLNYIGTEYRISRSDGSIEYMAKSIWKICKEYSIVMTIYDLLCYSEDKPLPPLTGQWQPVTRFIPTGSYMMTHIRISALYHRLIQVKHICHSPSILPCFDKSFIIETTCIKS